MKKNYYFVVVLLCLSIAANWFCAKKTNAPVQRSDSSIVVADPFANALDSAHLDSIIGQQTDVKRYKQQILAFYRHRGFKMAWADTNGLVKRAHEFYRLQASETKLGIDSSLELPSLKAAYEKYSAIKNLRKVDSSLIVADLLLTGQFFHYASKVYTGSKIDTKALGWYLPRKKVDYVALLDTILKSSTIRPITAFEPLDKEYRLLEKYLDRYCTIKKEYRWDSIKLHRLVAIGERSKYLPRIKKRLYLLGDLRTIDTSRYFGTNLEKAVKQFQARNGLKQTGRLNKATMKEMNRPIDSLITTLLINMERSRWMLPEKTYDPHIVVNIPEYSLNVYDSGRLDFKMDVVVGTAANNTVIFNGNLRYIVFSPFWNVTEEIVKKEIIPAIRKDSDYLEKHNMEIVKKGKDGIPVIRQKPGDGNALGGVKFIFPNEYNIYFHDTPFKEAFSESKRSFSHGCIRLGEPVKLAGFLLRKDKEITEDSIKALMGKGEEYWVTAKPSIPVTIKYFTAWVDEKGLLNFRDDIYGHDRKMGEMLFND